MMKLLLILFALPAFAEYRVYQYVIKNKVQTASDQPQSHVITSSLNPQGFVAYNGGGQLVSVDLIRTWMCPGHTAKRPLCPSPYGQLPKEIK